MSVGAALRAARVSAGVSVEELSERTRVRQAVLDAMEADDFSPCGGDFYARGHLRNLAVALGVDPAPLLAEYEEARPPAPVPGARALRARPPRPRRGPNWSAAMAAALAGVVGFGGYQVLTGEQVTRSVGPLVRAVPSAPARPAAPRRERPTSRATTSAIAAVPTKRVTVEMAARSSSWLSVSTASGRTLFRGTLAKGARRTFTDRARVRVVVGDAAAVVLTVNGKRLGAAGGAGEVVRADFAPGDPAAG